MNNNKIWFSCLFKIELILFCSYKPSTLEISTLSTVSISEHCKVEKLQMLCKSFSQPNCECHANHIKFCIHSSEIFPRQSESKSEPEQINGLGMKVRHIPSPHKSIKIAKNRYSFIET